MNPRYLGQHLGPRSRIDSSGQAEGDCWKSRFRMISGFSGSRLVTTCFPTGIQVCGLVTERTTTVDCRYNSTLGAGGWVKPLRSHYGILIHGRCRGLCSEPQIYPLPRFNNSNFVKRASSVSFSMVANLSLLWFHPYFSWIKICRFFTVMSWSHLIKINSYIPTNTQTRCKFPGCP